MRNPFLRPLFECAPKPLWKLAFNMGFRGWAGMREFSRRMERGGPFFPAFLMISLTDRCNYSCRGCWVSRSGRELDLAAVDSAIKSAKSMGSHFFGLLGGEPLLCPHILKILENHPDCYFQIFTNGSMLTPVFARELARLGNATAVISIEGLRGESARRRGSERAFDAALKAMENCRREGLFFGAASSVCRANLAELADMAHLDFLAGCGAHYMWYYIYRPVGPDPDAGMALDAGEVAALRKFIVDARRSAPLIVIDAYWDDMGRAICPAASGLSHHISPGGDLEFCPPIQFAAERMAPSSDLADLFANSEFLAGLRKLAASDSRGCILLKNPQALLEFVKSRGAADTSGRGTAAAELGAMRPRADHDMEGSEIPERGAVYRFLKKKYFFGFGAYG